MTNNSIDLKKAVMKLMAANTEGEVLEILAYLSGFQEKRVHKQKASKTVSVCRNGIWEEVSFEDLLSSDSFFRTKH